MSDDGIIVVIEFTKGESIGSRIFFRLPPEKLEEFQATSEKPDSRLKIVSTGISEEDALKMCLETYDFTHKQIEEFFSADIHASMVAILARRQESQ